MDCLIRVRVRTLLICATWLIAGVLVVLDATRVFNGGQVGILLAMLGATAWVHQSICTLKQRELMAFDRGRQAERRDLSAVK